MQHLRTELHRQAYKIRRRNTTTTKLDAPYTTLLIRGRASRIPVSSEVKGQELQTLNVHLQDLMPPESSTATDTTKSAAALVQKLPRFNDLKKEAQQLNGQEHLQVGRTEKGGGKLTRKEQRAKKLEASQAQSQRVKLRNRKVEEETKALIERNPQISAKAARKIARRVTKKAGKREQDYYMLQELVRRMPASLGQGPYDHSLEPLEAQDAPLPTIRRYSSVGREDSYQKHMAASEEGLDLAIELGSKSFSDHVGHGSKPTSVSIVTEESEGKDPGNAYISKEGSIFMVRKHLTMNPFERLQEIQRVGEITSREQAMGLHSQYHLALDEQLEETRKS